MAGEFRFEFRKEPVLRSLRFLSTVVVPRGLYMTPMLQVALRRPGEISVLPRLFALLWLMVISFDEKQRAGQSSDTLAQRSRCSSRNLAVARPGPRFARQEIDARTSDDRRAPRAFALRFALT